jgi:hypothetical protein
MHGSRLANSTVSRRPPTLAPNRPQAERPTAAQRGPADNRDRHRERIRLRECGGSSPAGLKRSVTGSAYGVHGAIYTVCWSEQVAQHRTAYRFSSR